MGSEFRCHYSLELTNTIITSVNLAGSACVDPTACAGSQTEHVSINFSKIKWIFRWYDGSGDLITEEERCWNVATTQQC